MNRAQAQAARERWECPDYRSICGNRLPAALDMLERAMALLRDYSGNEEVRQLLDEWED